MDKIKITKTGKDACMNVAKWSVIAFAVATVGGIGFAIAQDKAVAKANAEAAKKVADQLG